MSLSLGLGLGLAPPIGGGAYIAPAVHFDGNTWLSNPSVTATDGRFFFMSLWIALRDFETHNSQYPFVVDPSGNFEPSLQFINNGPAAQEASWSFYEPDFDHGMQIGNQFETIGTTYHHYLIAADTFAQTGQIYKDDIPQSQFDPDFINIQGELPADLILYNNLEWQFGGNVTQVNLSDGDVADVWIHTGVDFLDSPTSIPESVRRLFISADGKPVNPSVALAQLGQPVVLFSGNASTFGINQGTGGSFTLNGALTNSTTSPSD